MRVYLGLYEGKPGTLFDLQSYGFYLQMKGQVLLSCG